MKFGNRMIGRRLRVSALVTGLAVAGLLIAPAAQAASRTTSRTTVVDPGSTIYGGGYRCAVGANVRNAGGVFFVLPGHCAQVAATWYADAGQTVLVGTVAAADFPGDDYAVAEYAPGVTPGHTFTGAGDPFVGQSVCIQGPATGVRCGTVLGLNATISTGPVVSGLTETNICGDGALSGTPLYSGSTVLGILVTSSGSCLTGGRTYFQPITEVLAAYGMTIY